MRIGFVCSEYPPVKHGGIGSMTHMLARAFVEAGHEVSVTGIYPEFEGPVTSEIEGVRVTRLQIPPREAGGWVFARAMLLAHLTGWAARGEVDVIEAPDFEGLIAGLPPLRVPAVVRLHGTLSYFAHEMGQRTARKTYLIERAALNRADFWFSVSAYTAGRTRRLFRLTSECDAVMYNPVEGREALVFHERARNVAVFSGTLVAKKGVEPLARAWRVVAAKRPDAELHVYGRDTRLDDGGSMRGRMESLLGEAAQSVRFMGHTTREEVMGALSHARVAVYPSFAEAFAIAPLEAMAVGCPTIYSTRGSGPELITAGKDGLLIDPAREDELAAAILRVLDDDGLARSLGEAGHARVRSEFALEDFVERNVAYYASCIERHRARVSPLSVPLTRRLTRRSV